MLKSHPSEHQPERDNNIAAFFLTFSLVASLPLPCLPACSHACTGAFNPHPAGCCIPRAHCCCAVSLAVAPPWPADTAPAGLPPEHDGA